MGKLFLGVSPLTGELCTITNTNMRSPRSSTSCACKLATQFSTTYPICLGSPPTRLRRGGTMTTGHPPKPHQRPPYDVRDGDPSPPTGGKAWKDDVRLHSAASCHHRL